MRPRGRQFFGDSREGLKLYAQQLGFLHSTPKDWKQTRLELLVRQAKKTQERADTGLPELSAGQYIVDAMMVMGPTRSGGMGGEIPTDWDIILPFVSVTGRLSERWEIETLADMCRVYACGKVEGENPLSIPPVERMG